MHIQLEAIGKHYNREWIFRHLDHQFSPENPTVILGGNGSGKSTLLRLLAGHLLPSEGTITYSQNGESLANETIFTQVSMAAPYLDLFEDLKLTEAITFHQGFKPLRENWSVKQVIDRLQLDRAANKPLKNYSSGMRQRVKLGLAVLSNTSLLLLDEPVSNLDPAGIAWYQQLVEDHRKDRILVVASNRQRAEYDFCTAQLSVEDFKPEKKS